MNLDIKGSTKLFCVIGDPVAHSISPEIHNSIFKELGKDHVYIPMKIKGEYLKEGITTLKNGFCGFNVTIPHKQRIMEHLDMVEDQAAEYGAVNTVKIEEGKLKGYNTDGFGFSKSLEINNITVRDKKILLLGAGGAARVVAHELLKKGAKLSIATRNEVKARSLIKDLEKHFRENSCFYEDIKSIKNNYYGIVNATPVGMAPNTEDIPMDQRGFRNTGFVYDLIYNPYKTKLIEVGQAHGAKGINGLAMLFYQAVKAQEIWNDIELEDAITLPIYHKVENYLKLKFQKGGEK